MPPGALIRRPEGDEALAQAAIEGLTLHPRAPSSYRPGVYRGVSPRRKGFQAKMRRNGEMLWLGDFLTAEGAALAIAQRLAQDAAKYTWAQCDECHKWRIVPEHCVPGVNDRWYTTRCPNHSPNPDPNPNPNPGPDPDPSPSPSPNPS